MHIGRYLCPALACALVVTFMPLRSLSAVPAFAVANPGESQAAASFAEPAISPDRAEIAFISGGDIWSVPAAGGAARLLVATSGTAARPMFSPDGKQLAFVNARVGGSGVYTVTLAGGATTRLTHDDVTPELDGWSADGRFIYFATNAHNIGYDGDIMRVSTTGGTPTRVISERFVNAMEAAPAPDGHSVAYVRNGFVQWWRGGHSHMDQDELVVANRAVHRYDTLTGGDAKDRWPMWSADAATLFFVSDRSGSDEIWSHTASGLRRLTTLGAGPILWPTISRDGRVIAFEHAMNVWTYDTAAGTVRRVPIELHGGARLTDVAHVVQTDRFTALDLSADGKKLAFIARGRLFAAASTNAETPPQLVTTNSAAVADLPVWSNDNRRLAYVIDRGKEQAVAMVRLPDGAERVLTPAGQHDDYPHWSPNGTQLAFVRDGRELHLLDVESATDRVVARGFLDRRPFGDAGNIAFAPAGDWIAYIDQQAGFSNVRVVRASGGDSHAVSFLANGNAGPLSWSTDGKRLFFVTSQRTENGQVAQIDLVPSAPHFREDPYRRLFDMPPGRTELPVHASPQPISDSMPEPQPSPSSPPRSTTIDFNGIRERLSFLATGLNVNRIVALPDGKALVLVASAAGGQNLYVFPIDETGAPPVAREITSTAGQKSGVASTADGKTLFYLDGGSIWSVGVDGSGAKRASISAEFDVDFARERPLIFAQAWSLLDRWYADPHFHGVDWNAIERTYRPHAQAARTPDELRRVISLMLGELNSSHLGITAPRVPGVPRFTTGRLGVQWDADEYVRSGRLRITEIAPLSPVALAGHVEVGDDVLAVEGAALGPTVDIDELLANRVGKRTTLRIAVKGNSADIRSVAVLPVDTPAEQDLWYRGWVEGRRRYVERLSGGRLGYVHLLDMGEASLAQFYVDLDVQNRTKDGVIIDIRNNEGGFVDPYAIDVLTRRNYARFVSRFGSDPSERTSLGQRSFEKPTALVVNEHSLSDAENFTEAYRVLHSGPVIGEPTAGWIIFTDSATLADGSTLRLPSTRVFAHDGVDMERHPRPVDIRVANPAGATERGDDPQLDAAVHRLLR